MYNSYSVLQGIPDCIQKTNETIHKIASWLFSILERFVKGEKSQSFTIAIVEALIIVLLLFLLNTFWLHWSILQGFNLTHTAVVLLVIAYHWIKNIGNSPLEKIEHGVLLNYVVWYLVFLYFLLISFGKKIINWLIRLIQNKLFRWLSLAILGITLGLKFFFPFLPFWLCFLIAISIIGLVLLIAYLLFKKYVKKIKAFLCMIRSGLADLLIFLWSIPFLILLLVWTFIAHAITSFFKGGTNHNGANFALVLLLSSIVYGLIVYFTGTYNPNHFGFIGTIIFIVFNLGLVILLIIAGKHEKAIGEIIETLIFNKIINPYIFIPIYNFAQWVADQIKKIKCAESEVST